MRGLSSSLLLCAASLVLTTGCEDTNPGGGASRIDAGSSWDAAATDIGESMSRDAGQGDVNDAGSARDAESIDGGAPPDSGDPDPRCEITADGCCSTSVQYGGVDPDCPSLACELVPIGPDITLGVPARIGSATAMAFTGDTLGLAFTRPDDSNGLSYQFQRRELSRGRLLEAPSDVSVNWPRAGGPARAALDYEPRRDAWVFAFSIDDSAQFGALFLDGSGQPGSLLRFGELCTGFATALNVAWPPGGTAHAFGEYEDCASASWAHVTAIHPDGTRQEHRLDSNSAYAGNGVYDGLSKTHRSMFPVSQEGNAMGWTSFDPSTGMFGPRQPIPPARNPSADNEMYYFATDGEAFLVIGSQSDFIEPAGLQHSYWVGRYLPGTGWSNVTVLREWSLDRRLGEAAIAWTGSGYVATITEVDRRGASRVDDQDNPRVDLLHIAPDGTVRERAPLVDDIAVFANVRWAKDRVAVTWLQRPANGLSQRMLRLLACAP